MLATHGGMMEVSVEIGLFHWPLLAFGGRRRL
jgi:hypothetical protein